MPESEQLDYESRLKKMKEVGAAYREWRRVRDQIRGLLTGLTKERAVVKSSSSQPDLDASNYLDALQTKATQTRSAFTRSGSQSTHEVHEETGTEKIKRPDIDKLVDPRAKQYITQEVWETLIAYYAQLYETVHKSKPPILAELLKVVVKEIRGFSLFHLLYEQIQDLEKKDGETNEQLERLLNQLNFARQNLLSPRLCRVAP